MCIAAAGTCVMERDGYYITTGICLAVGLLVFVVYINPTAKRLQGLFKRNPSSMTVLLICLLPSYSPTFNQVADCYLTTNIVDLR
jgi:Acetyl-coenzyme A transporter 1